jgi:flagellar biosynthesis protein FlhG
LPDDKTVSAAVLRQIPYLFLDEKAAISKALRKLAANYLTDQSLTKGNSSSFTFVQKLKKFMLER